MDDSPTFDLLTFAVPQNLGSLEGTRILILHAFGYTTLMGMAYGFALRLAMVFCSCFGLAIYGVMVSEQAAKTPAATPVLPPLKPGEVRLP